MGSVWARTFGCFDEGYERDGHSSDLVILIIHYIHPVFLVQDLELQVRGETVDGQAEGLLPLGLECVEFDEGVVDRFHFGLEDLTTRESHTQHSACWAAAPNFLLALVP